MYWETWGGEGGGRSFWIDVLKDVYQYKAAAPLNEAVLFLIDAV